MSLNDLTLRRARLLFVLLAALLSGCALFEDEEEEALGPSPLTEIQEEQEFDRLWSDSVGDGQGGLFNRLRPAVGGDTLVVASADGQAFRAPLEEIAHDGVQVQVLGFREHASWALASDTLEFVDLEDIPGVFREPLPRIGLDSLPEQGAWLQPFRPLSALLTSRV